MRHVLARLALLPTLGGCSLIYNESNIPPPTGVDGAPDAEIIVDADPSMLKITGVTPSQITEGQGADGSRQALIVVDGEHMVKANLMVMVTASAAQKVPLLAVDTAGIDVDANGRRLAVPITLPVDDRVGTGLVAGDMVPLDITIIQTVPGGPTITRMLTAQLTVRGLNELTAEPANGFPGGLSEYSRVNITTGMLNAMAAATQPVQLYASSSLTITPMIDIAAAGTTPGPAGGAGGAGGAAVFVGTSSGAAGMGPAPGTSGGGNGGFIGNAELTTLADSNRSSGGGGGNGTTLGAGSNGGGGGGSIELTAAGHLVVGDIDASGAAGATNGANPGGGGSGGIILLRAGGNLTSGTLDVSGFPNAGRARFDAGGTGNVQGIAFRGPMFSNPPLITADASPMITFRAAADTTYLYFVSNVQTTTPAPSTTNGQGMGVFKAPLVPGMNQICLLVTGGTPTSPTRNCIQIAYLYKPPS